MASTKNSQKDNPYVLESIDSIKYMQSVYFSTGTNCAQSYKQKLDIINLICFLTQKMNQKDPDKYSSCLKVLSAIFETNLEDATLDKTLINANAECVRSFGLICDDLMWGTTDEITKPEGYSNAKEIKDKIISYFKDEWLPF